MASTAALFSPLSSNIYLPALDSTAADFNVSNSQINLTVTSHLALSPMLIAGWSDNAGRRPAYIACFTLYMGANAALIMQNGYMALLIFQCFQIAGSSAMVALCQGVVADVATAADRGSVYALYQITSLLIIDLFPKNPATATAANNLIRCSFAAASAACAVPLVEWLGVGWAYASAGLIAMFASALLWVLILWGPCWRREAALDEELNAGFTAL
ncbi:MAG: hypothetical protein LQ346_008281 [Caloplaca aetnensis]|nr:MAG: hypothetical protein LQ346_008281 [Caloplaca aetnensis]